VLPDLALSRARHDRLADSRPDPELVPRLLTRPTTDVVLVSAGRSAVVEGADGPRLVRLPAAEVPLAAGRYADGGDDADPTGPIVVLLGALEGRTVLALLLAVPDDDQQPRVQGAGTPSLPDGARWANLRELGTTLTSEDVGLAVEAVALEAWHRTHPRCPRCGAVTLPAAAGHERRCPADGSVHHPRSDPAVIMIITDDEGRLLLARQATWPHGRYSLLAGFVEPGESLEAAVVRETREESGLEVDEVRYLGSQPWPFPASLMLGFWGHSATTTITVDGIEIADALWVSPAELRSALSQGTIRLPPALSIARQMIEWWVGEPLPDVGGWP
jgi:NAD+ diphosphatase